MLGTVLSQKIKVIGACRTDSGVHAYEQVAMFRCQTHLPDDSKILRKLNSLLSPHICIHSLMQIADNFHAIRDACGKIYLYRVAHQPNPFLYPYVWQVRKKLNVTQMRTAARCLLGENDFTSFCAGDSCVQSKTRNLRDIQIKSDTTLLEFWFNGAGFLKQMIRTIVGTLVMIGSGHNISLPKVLAGKDRRLAGMTAPAKGLTLVKVYYDTQQSKNSCSQMFF